MIVATSLPVMLVPMSDCQVAPFFRIIFTTLKSSTCILVASLLDHQIGDFDNNLLFLFFVALFYLFTIDACDAFFYQKVKLTIS